MRLKKINPVVAHLNLQFAYGSLNLQIYEEIAKKGQIF